MKININIKRILLLVIISIIIILCFSISSCKKDVEINPLKTEEISYNILDSDKNQCWKLLSFKDSTSNFTILTIQNLKSNNKVKYTNNKLDQPLYWRLKAPYDNYIIGDTVCFAK